MIHRQMFIPVLVGIFIGCVVLLVTDRQGYRMGNPCVFNRIWKFFGIKKEATK